MGLTDVISGRRVCLDTNILVYLLEGSSTLERPLADLRAVLRQRAARFFVSSLALTEVLPPLVAKGDRAAVETACDFLTASGFFQIVAADAAVCIEAGLLRGIWRMKTPDAIHMATAIVAECDCMLTNDTGMRGPDRIERVIVSHFV